MPASTALPAPVNVGRSPWSPEATACLVTTVYSLHCAMPVMVLSWHCPCYSAMLHALKKQSLCQTQRAIKSWIFVNAAGTRVAQCDREVLRLSHTTCPVCLPHLLLRPDICQRY